MLKCKGCRQTSNDESIFKVTKNQKPTQDNPNPDMSSSTPVLEEIQKKAVCVCEIWTKIFRMVSTEVKHLNHN